MLDKKKSRRTILIVLFLLFLSATLAMFLLDVSVLRLFKTLYPRWPEHPFESIQIGIFAFLLAVGFLNGALTTLNADETEIEDGFVTILVNLVRTSGILTLMIIFGTAIVSIDFFVSFFALQVLTANTINLFCVMVFFSSVGSAVYLILKKESFRTWDSPCFEGPLVKYLVILSLAIIIFLRVLQGLLVSPLASYDSVYHNALINQILEKQDFVSHPFYHDMVNVYPILYHTLIAFLVSMTKISPGYLILAKEVVVFISIASATYKLTEKLDFSKNVRYVSLPLVFSHLPAGGNQPQSLAFLSCLLCFYALYLAQNASRTEFSLLSGGLAGMTLITHYGLAASLFVTILVYMIYLIIMRDFGAAALCSNTIWIAAIISSFYVIPSISAINRSYLLPIYVSSILFFFILGIAGHYAGSTRVANQMRNHSNKRLEPKRVGIRMSSNLVVLSTLAVFLPAMIWSIFVGQHGYGLISYAICGMYVPMGIVSLLALPFCIGGILHMDGGSHHKRKGMILSLIAPAFLNILLHILSPLFYFLRIGEYEGLSHFLSFNPYYYMLAMVGFSIASSFFIFHVLLPNIDLMKHFSSLENIAGLIKANRTTASVLILLLFAAGATSCRISSMQVYSDSSYVIHQEEREIICHIGEMTNENDVILSDGYTSCFIPPISNRKVFFSLHGTANNFRVFDIAERADEVRHLIETCSSNDLVRELRDLGISVVFIWKRYPSYFQDTTGTYCFANLTAAINPLLAAENTLILDHTNDYLLIHI